MGIIQGTKIIRNHKKRFSNLMHMDDIKIFAKNEQVQNALMKNEKNI